MEKVIFEPGAEIYIEKNDLIENILNNVSSFLLASPYMSQDNYTYIKEWGSFNFNLEFNPRNGIEEAIKIGVDSCIKLYDDTSNQYNKVNVNAWVNVVRGGKPKQSNFKDDEVGLHTHTHLQKLINSFHPVYTFVYYVQIPNNLIENEGSLIIEGPSGKRYHYLPKNGELVIMGGDIPHSPNSSPNSTIDRLVVAGNVGFENAKKQKSII